MPADDGAGPGAEPLCDRARAMADASTYEEIVELLRRALAAAEWSAPGLLAATHLEGGDRREAVDVLTPAVITGGRADLAGMLGETLAELGDHEHAEQAFLVGLDAGDAGAMNDYGVFLRGRGRTQEAVYVLDRAVRAGDDLAALNLVALHLEELDDLESAIAVAERQHDEHRPATLIALADVRVAVNRDQDAERLYRRAIALGASCAHTYYGWFLQDRREDLAGAEEHLRRAHQVREPRADYHLGRFLHDAGRLDDAQPPLEQAAARGDTDAQALVEAEYRGLVDQYDD